MTTATTPTLTVPHLRLGTRPEERLANLVLTSPRLQPVIPADELAALFTAFEAATEVAAEARRIPAEPDLAAEVDAALAAGDKIDPAELMKRVGVVSHAHLAPGYGGTGRIVLSSPRERVIAVLDNAASKAKDRVVNVVDAYRDDFFDALGDDLDALLDRAEPVAAALEGIESADAAISAGLADEWAQLQALTREYAAIRSEQAALIRHTAESPSNFAANTPGLAAAMFRGIQTVWPGYATEASTPSLDLMGNKVSRAPFAVFDVASPLHVMAAVRLRDRLMPYVGNGEPVIVEPAMAVPYSRG